VAHRKQSKHSLDTCESLDNYVKLLEHVRGLPGVLEVIKGLKEVWHHVY